MKRIVDILLAPVRYAWKFIHPERTAGRIPHGRLGIVVFVLAAVIFVTYTLGKKAIRLPFSSEPYQVQVIFPDAKGLDRIDEPGAAVAGTPLGRVTKVEYVDGRALATLTLEPDVEGKVFADATASIRPASALQNLLVNIDPGSPKSGPLPDGVPIPPDRTSSYVAIDELTSILDTDTQAYISILLEEARIATRGRDDEIRAALYELGELTDTATPVSAALAERRVLLTRLVGHLEKVFVVLGERGRQLAEAVDAGARTLEVTASRETELAAITSELAPTLEEAQRTLVATQQLAEPLIPALDRLVPAAGTLDENLASLRSLLPRAESLVTQFEGLVRDGSEPLALQLEGTTGIKRRIQKIVPVAKQLTTLARIMDRYKEGAAQTADTLSGAMSVQDNGGAYGQVSFLKFDSARPENFGFPKAEGERGREAMQVAIAKALEQTCRNENPYACVARFQIPGLPKQPLSGGGGK